MSDRAKISFILLLAAGLRFLGLAFAPYHPDEHLVVNYSLAFGAGDLNPHMFFYPTYHLYQLFFLDGLFYVLGRLFHLFLSADDFLKAFMLNPLPVYMLNRSLSALYGVLTVWVLAKAGGRYAGKAAGLWAAYLLALNFLHGRDSHFATVDVPMTFYMVLSFYFSLKAADEKQKKYLYWASLAAGLATAVKYNACLMALPVLWVGLCLGAYTTLLLCALLTAAGFFLGAPFFLLDFKNAIGFLLHLKELNAHFHIPWNYHLRVLGEGMGWFWIGLAALGFFNKSVPWRKKGTLAVLLIPYYVMVARAGQPFERYILPMIPFCLLSASTVLPKRRSWAVISVFLILLASGKSFYSSYLFLQKDTRLEAKEWIEKNIPDGAVVFLDDSMQSPRLLPSGSQIEERLSHLGEDPKLGGIKRKRLETLLNSKPYPKPAYTLYYLSDAGHDGGFSLYGPMMPYEETLMRNTGGKYLVANHLAEPRQPRFYEGIHARWKPVAVFSAARREGLPISSETWTYLPIGGLLWNYGRPGPNITIYERMG